ncbi:ketopantoate reductase family protein [Aromatoleum evansii]|uniref:ketopantoate reductase family protein n=1 Tax=Aromatoleum evansii TaxID=59406 RepID=UPI00145CC1A9|nr:2-dehydropantoate 2-reductase [Aromatoleum evansii]NMG32089.1 2-dehydropantoate 2-reductase [Aromatoleum evansii]
MRIAVMGAGAVGCYYGGMLARAGHEVILVGRPAHVEAVTRDGLLLDTRDFQVRVPVKASTGAEGVRGTQLVLCCVKSTDTATAAAEMAPHLAPEAIVLSLQNGVDNAERLQALLGREVGAAVVYVATEMAGPGHVKHHGRGELVIGPSDASGRLVELFGAAGVPVEVSENVVGALWAKLILNCAYNALSAITQLPYGRLVAGDAVEDVMRDAVQECLDLAWAEGITVPGDCWAAVQRIAQTMPMQFSSTAQDLARGKRSEIDHLNGFVLRRGKELGVATPVNRVLYSLVKLLEERAADARVA